jgi:phage host-nuclease inhibitor protein Gam
MPPTRRKAPRQQAPQTIEEAVALLATYVDIVTGVEELRADADASIAAIQAERDRMIAPLEEQAKALFLQLRAWWSVAGEALTEGKRKSHELAGCILGERTTPPSLKMPGKAEESAVALVNAGLAELCRHKVEVDKPAVIKAIAAGEAAQAANDAELGPEEFEELVEVKILFETLAELGFRVSRKEEFFIDRAAPKPAAVEKVALPEAAE